MLRITEGSFITDHPQDPGFKFCAFDTDGGWHVQLVDGIELVHEHMTMSAFEAGNLAEKYGFDMGAWKAWVIGLALVCGKAF